MQQMLRAPFQSQEDKALTLLAAVPSANEGLRALMNRLFDASEAVNAYAYARFDVPDDQPVAFAVMLLSAAGLSIAAMVLLSRSRLPAARQGKIPRHHERNMMRTLPLRLSRARIACFTRQEKETARPRRRKNQGLLPAR